MIPVKMRCGLGTLISSVMVNFITWKYYDEPLREWMESV